MTITVSNKFGLLKGPIASRVGDTLVAINAKFTYESFKFTVENLNAEQFIRRHKMRQGHKAYSDFEYITIKEH